MEFILKLLLATALGALIGFEREKYGHHAGFRTNVVVCLTSTIITLVSTEYFPDPDSAARIITALLTGVGFIGAGTIIITKDHVIGLTTAATIWAVCGLGVVIGLGHYSVAILFAILIIIFLRLKVIEKRLRWV